MKHIDIHPFLDKDKQAKAKTYENEKRQIGIIGSVLSLVFILLFYFSGLSNYYSDSCESFFRKFFYVKFFFRQKWRV